MYLPFFSFSTLWIADNSLTCDLCLDQSALAVLFSQDRLLDFTSGISGNLIENNLLGTLISGQFHAEIIDLCFCAGYIFLDFDDGSCDLTQSGMRQADDCHVLDLIKSTKEIFNLDSRYP